MKDWLKILATGFLLTIAINAVLGVIALVIGFSIAYFSSISPWITSFIVYLGLKLIIGLVDAIGEGKPTRCSECNRVIRTSRSVKCVGCGGAALVK